jgi:hypothetical protein
MQNNIYLALILCITVIGCKTEPIDNMDKDLSGRLNLSSSLLITAIDNMPIGLTSHNIDSLLSDSKYLKYYQRDSSIFEGPYPWIKDMNDSHTIVQLNIKGSYPTFRMDYLRDTCVSMFLMDTTSNINHIKSCVDYISNVIGKPIYRHYDSYKGNGEVSGYIENVDRYTWVIRNSTLILEHRIKMNSYWIDLTDSVKWNQILTSKTRNKAA